MIPTITITVPHRVKAARIIPPEVRRQMCLNQAAAATIAQRTQTLEAATQAMYAAAAKLMELHNSAIKKHNTEIARLAVEIARKVIAQEVSDRNYKIESVINAAIESLPASGDELTVRLNPDDQSACRQAYANDSSAPVRIVPDARVGRAECVIETPKGTVESFIEQHLAKITEALAGAHE
jgi:flagellar biosynthesis/type III secretory pathway protein FliH